MGEWVDAAGAGHVTGLTCRFAPRACMEPASGGMQAAQQLTHTRQILVDVLRFFEQFR